MMAKRRLVDRIFTISEISSSKESWQSLVTKKSWFAWKNNAVFVAIEVLICYDPSKYQRKDMPNTNTYAKVFVRSGQDFFKLSLIVILEN